MQAESSTAVVHAKAVVENIDTNALFRTHAQFVAGFASRLGVDESDVGDIVQEVFVVVHRKGGYKAGPARPTTWLAEIVIRVAAAYRRKRARQSRVPEKDAPASEVGLGSLDEAQMFARIEAALADLSEKERVVFVLFELEGEPCASIAAALGVPINTVYGRLHAARASFRTSIERLARGARRLSEGTAS